MTTADLLPPSAQATWKTRTGAVGGFVLGAVLVVALLPKVMDPWAFQAVIEQQGLDFLLPARAVAFVGLTAEALLGFALVLLIRRRWVLWPSVALVAFFLFLTGRHYYLDAHGLAVEGESCGCFGDMITRTPAEAFWQDLLLLVPALLLSFLGRPAESEPLPRKRLALAAVLSLGVLIYAATVSKPEPLLRIDAVPSALCEPGEEGQEGRLCLDAVVPELADEGSDHILVLTEIDDPAFLERLEAFEDYVDAMTGPQLWVISPVGEETLDAFLFDHELVFEVLAARRTLLEALAGSLPRSFRVQDGKVTSLWDAWPPLDDLSAGNPDSEGDGEYDDHPEPGDTESDDNPDDNPEEDPRDEDGDGD